MPAISRRYLPVYPMEIPDVTFATVVYQLHWLSGNFSYRRSILELFGARTTLSSHFPRALAALAKMLPEKMGLSHHVLLERFTPLPYVRPFLLSQSEDDFIKSLQTRTGSEVSLNNMFGKRTHANLSRYEMRFCPACVIEGEAKYGLRYWRRSHQIPEVTVCPTHRLRLKTTCPTCGVFPRDSKTYTTPGLCGKCNSDLATEGLREEPLPETSLDFRLSSLVTEIIQSSLPPLDSARLKDCYYEKIEQLGFAGRGRIFQTELAGALREYYGNDYLDSLGANQSTRGPSPALWRHITQRNDKAPTKPLYHCLLILFLFGSLDQFLAAYRREESTNAVLSRGSENPDSPEPVADTSGIPALTPPFRGAPENLILHLYRLHVEGYLDVFIIRECAVNAGVVRNFRRLNPEVAARWEKAKFDRMGAKYRALVEKACSSGRPRTLAGLFSKCRAAAVWLYKNDHAWLVGAAPVVGNEAIIARHMLLGSENGLDAGSNDWQYIPRRAHVLSSDLKTKIMRDLAAGLPLSTIAKSTGQHKRVIKYILEMTEGLVEKRQASELENQKLRYRKSIAKLAEKHHPLTRSMIKHKNAPMLPWMEKNDPDWLMSQLTPSEYKEGADSFMDDANLANRIRETARSLRQDAGPDGLITKNGLVRMLDCTFLIVKERLSYNKVQFPQSLAALASVVETRQQWWHRRLTASIAELDLQAREYDASILLRHAGISFRENSGVLRFAERMIAERHAAWRAVA